MAFSITNTGKAKDILKEAKINYNQIIEGNSASLILDIGLAVQEILENSECKKLEALDKAGVLLKESILTRSTAHKKYDFSSIQATSSRNLQELYKNIFNNMPSEVFSPKAQLDPKLQKEITKLSEKMGKSIEKINKLVKSDPEIEKFVKEQLKDDSVTASTLNKLEGLLPKDIQFITDNKVRKGTDISTSNLKKSLKSLGVGTIVGLAAGALTGGLTFAAAMGGGSLLSLILLCFVPAAVGVGYVTGFAVPAAVAAVFLIAALVSYCNKDRFGTIALKKILIKIDDEFTNALKCLNKAAYLVRTNAKKEDKEEQAPKPGEGQITALNNFLKKQKDLWEPYTSVLGREYNKSEKDKENSTHKSGLITVNDTKASTIGKMKEGIAKTWFELRAK